MHLRHLAHIFLLFSVMGLGACGGSSSQTTNNAKPADSPTATPQPGTPQITDMRMYIFGHSLINHEATSAPPPSNENSVPHWMVQFAEEQGYSYTVDGQYGFLRNHTEFPPVPQWGFDLVEEPWGANPSLSFSEVNFTTVLLTPANFIQYQPDTNPYDGDNPTNTTPLAETLTLIDWIVEQEPDADIYIYENWPALEAYDFPPNQDQMAEYHSETLTNFHSWWQTYHDNVREARPGLNIRMIPVGPIISTVLTNTELRNIAAADLYEDDAPHGRPTIYFLAGLITYMATYGVEAPSDFAVPNTVHSDVQTYYDDIVMTIWNALHTYTTANDTSRVF